LVLPIFQKQEDDIHSIVSDDVSFGLIDGVFDGSMVNTSISTYSYEGYSYVMNNTNYRFEMKEYSDYGDGFRFSSNNSSIVYQPQDISYRDEYGSQDYHLYYRL
jgi:hypothetical protein